MEAVQGDSWSQEEARTMSVKALRTLNFQKGNRVALS